METSLTSRSQKNRHNEIIRNSKKKSSKHHFEDRYKSAIETIHDIKNGIAGADIKRSQKHLSDRKMEMKRKQLPNVPQSKAFRPGDLQRIVQHTATSIFHKEDCALWTGYITNLKNKKKGTYINFYFRDKKKVALHRLLYANFKGVIGSNEYVKYSCENKGKCCNINHMIKFKYNTSNDDEKSNKQNVKAKKTKKDCKKGKHSKNIDRRRSKRSGRSKTNRNTPLPLRKDDFKIRIY